MSTKKLKIHFVGIGGIGVSALAQYYLAKGYKISGSDLVSSEITEALKKKGAKLLIGKHKAKNLPKNVEMVIYSPAVPKDNPELKEGGRLKIKCLSYPEALGELTKKYFTIAVSGTHGKSTTTAMIGLILIKAGLDPTVIVGTKVPQFGGSNCRVGKSKYLVIEADEWQASFLNYWPKIIVLTNIEREHLDFYKNLRNILKTYREYIGHLPKEGILIVNSEDKNIQKVIAKKVHVPIFYFYFSGWKKEANKLREILKIPGGYNVYNALAALTVARVLGISDKISLEALSKYKGSWRRFETTEIRYPIRYTLVSDYAHHPTEIRVTLKAAREKYPKKEIWCIFQPHQYQRTYYLFNDFVKVFREAPVNKLIITDIYDVAGREATEIKKRVSSEKLVQAINNRRDRSNKSNWSNYLPKGEIVRYLKENLKGGEVIIIMGAGDIYKLVLHLTEKGERKKIK